MNPINILFFAIASIIGMEDASIVSRKVSITINPVDKTFEILQEDLFSIIILTDDSLMVANELRKIAEFCTNVKQKNFNGLTVEKIILNKHNQQLNAALKGSYTDPKVLAEAGIYFDTETDEFSMINIPEWNMRSSDSILKDDTWIWTAHKSVTFVMEPFENIPDEYLEHRRSMLPYWKRWQESQPKIDYLSKNSQLDLCFFNSFLISESF
ncbi:hypothetical protein [Olivibacter domesticus]|uniref:Uncharacterized protein n=1 Tax=Olivibacter domesticus TaxID=407022 RepID=A0A1H7Q897_OLID1|nr:hypothetical protein [Olivibacter domesticus]SEL44320.1 hypothetical protein SAMN05661044_02503 [Olivibacter domesticus]